MENLVGRLNELGLLGLGLKGEGVIELVIDVPPGSNHKGRDLVAGRVPHRSIESSVVADCEVDDFSPWCDVLQPGFEECDVRAAAVSSEVEALIAHGCDAL